MLVTLCTDKKAALKTGKDVYGYIFECFSKIKHILWRNKLKCCN